MFFCEIWKKEIKKYYKSWPTFAICMLQNINTQFHLKLNITNVAILEIERLVVFFYVVFLFKHYHKENHNI